MVRVDGITCLLFLLMMLAIWLSLSNPRKRERYERPNLTCARINAGVGEFEVTSSHSEHLVREMNLPPNSTIHIRERNHSYLIRFKLPAKQTPDIWMTKVLSDAGEEKEFVVHYSERQADRAYVQDWAKANGYQGPIEGR